MRHRMFNRTLPAPRLPGPALKFLLTLALHGALLYWALHAMPGLAVLTRTAPVPIRVALIAPPRPAAVQPATPPRPLPRAIPAARPLARPATRPMRHNTPKPAPAPLPAAASGTAAMASAPAEPGAAAAVANVAVAVAAAPALEPARFDAGYLNNPAPAYPLLSRRQGEAGKVLLLVQVSAHGAAAQVEIKQGSGFSRLDQAALDAVRQWRFVPARRGDTAVAASVVVPITFRLGG